VAAQFPRPTLVVAPATGHSVLGADTSGCATRAFVRFFRGSPVPTACPSGRRQPRVVPPPPQALRQVSPLPTVTGRRGRTLAALALTLVDVAEDSVTQVGLDEHSADLARGGGLRAGRYRIDGRGTLTLRGVSFVPGVRLSGKLKLFATRRQRGRIRVGGRAATRGLIAVRGSRARGRLGGRRVRTRLKPQVIGSLAAAAHRPARTAPAP